MPDMTVTWKGAVPVYALKGQQAAGAAGGDAVVADARSMAGGFDIRPLLDSSVESAYKGAVPYASTDDDFSWADEFQAATEQVEIKAVPKRGRPKKEG